IGGAVFGASTGGIGFALTAALVFKSSYAIGASVGNLVAAFNDCDPSSTGSFFRDIAAIVSNDKDLDRGAAVLDLSLDLAGLVTGRVLTNPHLVDRFGNILLEGGAKYGRIFAGNTDAYLDVLTGVDALKTALDDPGVV